LTSIASTSTLICFVLLLIIILRSTSLANMDNQEVFVNSNSSITVSSYVETAMDHYGRHAFLWLSVKVQAIETDSSCLD
jgi:hypothetical protein